ncbi:SGNH/GDSL hydrolase family protein [Paenibacillus dendritiformis]|uniref:SGNH/GDSL hydrolase family protein n=1 Tax=Paenibacillus dendritiformis TaxID=130049 RepID=UPI00248CB431|nr:SGNH/GDSL hydrolase family protein [Paenibacillus dendritiformis]WGU96104.1 SGNH/GDSL hydrolase family protein [Paenibacillus dendritiformis]
MLANHTEGGQLVFQTSSRQLAIRRPGMAYTNILSRRIPLEFMNLGFSGSGCEEPEMAHIITEIANPAMLVLDYEANAINPDLLKQTLPSLFVFTEQLIPLFRSSLSQKWSSPASLSCRTCGHCGWEWVDPT